MDVLAVWYDSFFDDPMAVLVALYAFIRLGLLLNRKRTKAAKLVETRNPHSILVLDLRTLHRHPALLAAGASAWALLNTDVKTILFMEVW